MIVTDQRGGAVAHDAGRPAAGRTGHHRQGHDHGRAPVATGATRASRPRDRDDGAGNRLPSHASDRANMSACHSEKVSTWLAPGTTWRSISDPKALAREPCTLQN